VLHATVHTKRRWPLNTSGRPEPSEAIRPDVAGVTEVLAAWNSPAVAEFVQRLGIAGRWPGASFFAQNAAELVNSMGSFRAFAAAVPVADGRVCRTQDDARLAMTGLLARHDAVMVKKAHGGAGAGNQIVSRDPDLATGHAGGTYTHTLGPGERGVADFWQERWDWASSGGRYPVVVERFVPDAQSVYAEFFADDAGVRLRELGELIFAQRSLTMEVVPLRGLAASVRDRLVDAAHRLAAYYHRLGYRGHLSCDAVVHGDAFTFTEVNAQVTGSSHLYGIIGHRIVDVWRDPQRSVTQCVTESGWRTVNFAGFLAVLTELGCAYDPATRKGVVAVTPHIGGDERGPIVYAMAHETPTELTATVDQLAKALG